VLAQAYSEAAGPAVDALETEHGITWQVLDNFLYPGHSVHRMHAVAERTGAALMGRLAAAAEAAGVIVLTEARVTELWADGADALQAVGYVRPDGTAERLACRSVLLACNGYGGNSALLAELLPEMASATYAGHVGNDGSAILWGRQLGAGLADLGAYQGHGSWAIPQGALISWGLMMEGGVQVNRLGERFHDETQGYSEAAVHVLAQPDGIAWNVFDDEILQFAQDFPDFREAQAAGAVRHAADAGELAAAIGCAPDTLARTLGGQGHRRAVSHPGRAGGGRALPGARCARASVSQPPRGGRCGARRIGQCRMGLSVRQRIAERHCWRPYRCGERSQNRLSQDAGAAQLSGSATCCRKAGRIIILR
jgi:fumarate reductase flavoprotein subunit